MNRTIIATMIDPRARTIKPWVLHLNSDGSAYKALVDAVFRYSKRRGCIECVPVGAGHDMYIDGEGVFVPWDEQGFFKLGNQTFAGVAVIVSKTSDWRIDHCMLPLEMIANNVQWLDARDVRIPAPVMQTMRPDGTIETVYLAGCREWTYDNQPR